MPGTAALATIRSVGDVIAGVCLYSSVMTELLTAPRRVSVDDGFDRLGTALSDAVRRGVLVALLDGPAFPSDLAASLGTSRSNLSNHLACLRGCGLVAVERSGRHLRYRLIDDELSSALATLVAVAGRLPACDSHLP